MKTPTVPALKKWARANKPLAEAVLMAQAFAEIERERVEAYIEPLFLSYGFVDDKGEKITHSKWLFTSDQDTAEYFAACDKAHRAHGFNGAEGHCPALEAESLLRECQNALLDELATFMGVESIWTTLEQRAAALEIALGVCMKDPLK